MAEKITDYRATAGERKQPTTSNKIWGYVLKCKVTIFYRLYSTVKEKKISQAKNFVLFRPKPFVWNLILYSQIDEKRKN